MKGLGWVIGPARPIVLPRNVIDIWKFSLSDANLMQASEALLSTSETIRAANIGRVERRNQFRASRSCLRDILHRYLQNTSAKDVGFSVGKHGKPFLSDNGKHSFNMAHTGVMGLIAVASGREVGVDVEKVQRQINNINGLMVRCLRDDEVSRIMERANMEGGGEEKMKMLFLKMWTQKEAFVKCTGEGIARGLQSFRIDDRSGEVNFYEERDAFKQWRVKEIEVDDDHVASLCYSTNGGMSDGEEVNVRLLEWRPA